MSQSTERSQDSDPPDSRKSRGEKVIDYCVPSQRNIKGPERAGRAIIGLGIGGFGITGALAARRPIIGVALSIILLVITLYLLVTAKTKKCPAKHITKKQIDRV